MKIVHNNAAIFKKAMFVNHSNEIIANLVASKPNDHEILLETLTVAEQYRRKGLATALLCALAEFLQTNGFVTDKYTVILLVASTNDGALKLYKKIGFAEYAQNANNLYMKQAATDFAAHFAKKDVPRLTGL